MSELDADAREVLERKAAEKLRAAADRQPGIALPPLASTTVPQFAGDAETLQLLASVVREMSPRHVIEFGCGASTELLAQLGFEHGRMAVTTFEHDPWAAEALISVAGPLAVNYRWFSFCVCPLVARRRGANCYPVYDDGMTAPTVPYPADLVVIKGPPATLGGRGGTIYQALKYARPGAIVLLLDIRQGEDAMLDAWSHELDEHLRFVPPGLLRRHLTFVVLKPLSALFSDARFCSQKDLVEQIAFEPDSAIAAVDA